MQPVTISFQHQLINRLLRNLVPLTSIVYLKLSENGPGEIDLLYSPRLMAGSYERLSPFPKISGFRFRSADSRESSNTVDTMMISRRGGQLPPRMKDAEQLSGASDKEAHKRRRAPQPNGGLGALSFINATFFREVLHSDGEFQGISARYVASKSFSAWHLLLNGNEACGL